MPASETRIYVLPKQRVIDFANPSHAQLEQTLIDGRLLPITRGEGALYVKAKMEMPQLIQDYHVLPLRRGQTLSLWEPGDQKKDSGVPATGMAIRRTAHPQPDGPELLRYNQGEEPQKVHDKSSLVPVATDIYFSGEQTGTIFTAEKVIFIERGSKLPPFQIDHAEAPTPLEERELVDMK